MCAFLKVKRKSHHLVLIKQMSKSLLLDNHCRATGYLNMLNDQVIPSITMPNCERVVQEALDDIFTHGLHTTLTPDQSNLEKALRSVPTFN